MLLSQQHTIIWYGELECWAGMIVWMFGRLWLRLQIAHFWQHFPLQAKGSKKDPLFLMRWNVVNLGIREEKWCHLQNSTEGTALGWIHHKVERWCSAACLSHPQERAHPLQQLSPKEWIKRRLQGQSQSRWAHPLACWDGGVKGMNMYSVRSTPIPKWMICTQLMLFMSTAAS